METISICWADAVIKTWSWNFSPFAAVESWKSWCLTVRLYYCFQPGTCVWKCVLSRLPSQSLLHRSFRLVHGTTTAQSHQPAQGSFLQPSHSWSNNASCAQLCTLLNQNSSAALKLAAHSHQLTWISSSWSRQYTIWQMTGNPQSPLQSSLWLCLAFVSGRSSERAVCRRRSPEGFTLIWENELIWRPFSSWWTER